MNGNAAWRRFRLLAGVAGFAATVACHTMRPIEASQLVSGNVPAIWVTASDQSTVILHAPHLSGDTLGGFVDGHYREMLLSDTQIIKARASAPVRTAAVGVAAGVTTLFTLIYFANRSYVGDGQTCYTPKDGTVVPCCAGKSTLAC
jgi:hypothetical protein